MKIFYFTETSFPNGFAATNRIICTAKAIQTAGLECMVIPYMRTEAKNDIKNQPEGTYEGIYYKYIGGKNIYSNHLIVRKIVSIADLIRCLFFVFNKAKRGDIIFVYHVYLLFAPLLCFCVHVKKAKVVTDVCEIPYGVTAVETSVMRLKRKLLFKWIYPFVDGFIVISENLKNLIVDTGVNKKHILKVPILVDYKQYDLEDKSVNTDEKFFFHAGKLEEQKDGYLSIVKAFAIACKDKNFQYNYYSTGKAEKSPHAKEIIQVIKENGIEDRFIFLGYLTDVELKEYLSKASAVIINKNKNQQNEYCFSTKLGEYLAAGKAVITTNVGEANNWLRSGVDSIIIEHDNIEKLSEAMVLISRDTSLRDKISVGAKVTSRKCFDYHNYGFVFKEFFESL